MTAALALLLDADAAEEGRWQSVSVPLPDLDRAEAAAAEGDATAAAVFLARAAAEAERLVFLAAQGNLEAGDGMDRLLALARSIGVDERGRPVPASIYAIEFRCPVGQEGRISVWLTLARRDRLTGAVSDLAGRRLRAAAVPAAP